MGCCFSAIKTIKLTRKRNNHRNQEHQTQNNKKKNHSFFRKKEVIPSGKRTDFGYDKDFEKRYTMGKLLGHGQYGYTYVATDNSNGDRVAVKKIDKNKVLFLC